MKLSAKEFEYQFRCLYRPLNMYALRYTENLDDAEDIVQQAFSDVWEKLVGGTSIQNLKAYMYQTVRNRSLTLVTNRQTHCETTELTDLEDLTEEERIIRSERDARLWTAIDHLPTERKKIFLLSKRDGLTYQEIATELGISIKTVEHQISKALKTLRETAIKIYTFSSDKKIGKRIGGFCLFPVLTIKEKDRMEKEEKDIRFVARFYRENRLDTTQAWQKLGIGKQKIILSYYID